MQHGSSPGALLRLPHCALDRKERMLWMRTGSYFSAPMSWKSRRASSDRSFDALNHTACAGCHAIGHGYQHMLLKRILAS